MGSLITVILPVFLLIGAGYLATRGSLRKGGTTDRSDVGPTGPGAAG